MSLTQRQPDEPWSRSSAEMSPEISAEVSVGGVFDRAAGRASGASAVSSWGVGLGGLALVAAGVAAAAGLTASPIAGPAAGPIAGPTPPSGSSPGRGGVGLEGEAGPGAAETSAAIDRPPAGVAPWARAAAEAQAAGVGDGPTTHGPDEGVGGEAGAGAGADSLAGEGEASQALPWGDDVLNRDSLPGLLLAFGIGLFAVVLLRRSMKRRRRQARSPEAHLTAAERIQKVHDEAAANREPIESLMSDAEELTRHLAAALDNRAARVEALLDEADRKIQALEQRAGAAGVSGGGGSAGSGRLGAPGRVPSPRGALGAGRPGTSAGLAGGLSRSAAAGGGASPAVSHEPAHGHELRERVYAMADAGHEPTAIARELDKSVGQVELILALRRSAG